MEIEMDRGAIFKPSFKDCDNAEELKQGSAGDICGNEMRIWPNRQIDAIYTYCHEVGHYMGDFYSFTQTNWFGHGKNVLNFDEIKEHLVSIKLTKTEIDFLRRNWASDKENTIEIEAISVANKLLKAFFKGRFDPKKIHLSIEVSEDESGVEIKENPSSEGEDYAWREELASIATEVGCALILENTMKKYGVLKNGEQIMIDKMDDPFYQRPLNIVAKAFYGRGWRIPSMVDLGVPGDMD